MTNLIPRPSTSDRAWHIAANVAMFATSAATSAVLSIGFGAMLSMVGLTGMPTIVFAMVGAIMGGAVGVIFISERR